MAPLNWGVVMNISLDSLADDKGDDLYNELVQYDPEDEDENFNNVKKLKRLFLVTRGLMQLKSMQADIAMEEVLQMSERERRLHDEIDELQQQLDSKATLDESGSITYSRTEITNLEKEIEDLHDELRQKQQDLMSLKQSLDKDQYKINILESENSELKSENQLLREEVVKGHQHIEQLQDVTEIKGAKSEEELSQKINDKNRQINKLLDEVKDFENENDNLQQKITGMKEKLEEAAQQMEKTTNDYITFKRALEESEKTMDSIKRERDYYKNEVTNFNRQINLKDDNDDQILMIVSKRVEEWKDVLMKKEEEILRYQELVKKLQSHMVSVRMDGEHTTVAVLSKALDGKDKEIFLLKQQLARATKDIEESSRDIENLKAQLNGKLNFKDQSFNNIAVLQSTLHETTSALGTTQDTLAELEEESKKKDKTLSETLNRMRQYEMGQYGLADAVAEIKECKNMIRIRDKQIEDLIQQMNMKEIESGEILEENEALRLKLGMKDPDALNSLPKRFHRQKEHNTILALQQQVEKLEEERVQLRQQLHDQKRENQHNQKQKENTPSDSPTVKMSEISQTSSPTNKKSETSIIKLQADNDNLRKAIEDLTSENKQLQLTLMEFLESLKGRDEKTRASHEALESLIKTSINKHISTSSILQSKRNKESHSETKPEIKKFSIFYPEAPSDFKSSSNLLNSYIIEILKEFELLEQKVIQAEEKLEKCHTQFLTNQHQVSLLYQQHLEKKSEYESKEKKWKEERKDLVESKEVDSVKLEEFQHLLDTLAQDEPEVRRRLSEIVRQMTALRVSEGTFRRKATALQDIEADLQKENNKLRHELALRESLGAEHIGELQRFKDMATYKIKALQTALEESVPRSEMDPVNKQYIELAFKYSAILEKEVFVSNLDKEQLQMSNNLENENRTLLKMLQDEKKKVQKMEALVENMTKQGLNIDKSSSQEIDSLSERIAELEVKELNEHQRADHIYQIYCQQKQVIKSLEERNTELEEKVANLTEQNLNGYRLCEKPIENEAKEADMKKVKELEESEMKLQIEVCKLKEISDIACQQLKCIQKSKTTQDQEIKMLQKQVLELQASNDDKMMLGKLYRQILQLQLNEVSNKHQSELTNNKIIKMDAEILKLTKRCSEKEETIYTLNNKLINKTQRFMKIIREMKREYSGSVPLSKFEKMYNSVASLREEKAHLTKELQRVKDISETADLKHAELEMKNKLLEQTLKDIKNNATGEKILDWHTQMEAVHLNELRSKREIEKKIKELAYKDNLITYFEKQVTELEEENVKLEKKLEDKWLHWEDIQKDYFQEITGDKMSYMKLEQSLPQKPIHSPSEINKVEQAMTIIKSKQTLLDDSQEEIKQLKDQLNKLQRKLEDTEKAVLARDHVIVKLQSSIPVSNENSRIGVDDLSLDHSETKHVLKTAHSAVECLQARLKQKESSLTHYKDLLRTIQEEAEVQKIHHHKELLAMSEKLQSQQDHAVSTMRQVASEMANKPTQILTSKQKARLYQLEELVVDQEREIMLFSQQLDGAQKEIEKWKKEVEIVRRQRDIDQQSIEEDLKNIIKTLEQELSAKEKEITEYKEAITVLDNDLHIQKEAFKDATNKKTVNVYKNLKHELSEKEKQLQALSKALTDLRSDMMETVQDTIASQKYGSIDQSSINKAIEESTKELQDKLNTMESQNAKLKRDVKQCNDKLSSSEKEIKGFREDIARKTDNMMKLRKENEIMQKKINRMKISLQEKKVLQTESDEIAKLQQKILQLEEQLKRQQTPEKPYDQLSELTKSQQEIIRWEEGKKWQQTVERLKQRNQSKDEELENFRKTEKLLRDQISRCDREKMMLEGRIKSICQKFSSESNEAALKSEAYQELFNKCTVLETEKKVAEESLKTCEKTNKKLLNQIDLLKDKISHLSGLAQEEHFRELEDGNNQILKLKEENLELKLKLKQLEIDVPNLNKKVSDLQNCCEVLQNELHIREQKSFVGQVQGKKTLHNKEKKSQKFAVNLKRNARNKESKVKLTSEMKHPEQINKFVLENKVQDDKDNLRISIKETDTKSNLQLDVETLKQNSEECKLQEDKIKELEQLLLEKSQALNDVKNLLKESIEREENLLHGRKCQEDSIQEEDSAESGSIIRQNTELKLETAILKKEIERKKISIEELNSKLHETAKKNEDLKMTVHHLEKECAQYKERWLHLSESLGIETVS